MKTSRICLLLTFLLFYSSCSKPETALSGEVFVATAGAGTYKMGAINVYVFKEVDMNARINEFDDLLTEGVRNYNDSISTCNRVIANAKTFTDEAIAEWKADTSCETLKANTVGNLINSVFAQRLPDTGSTTSNSEGRYSLNLKEPGSYFLMARGQRAVGQVDEEYVWIQKVNATGKPIVVDLSNNNLLDHMGILTLVTSSRARS